MPETVDPAVAGSRPGTPQGPYEQNGFEFPFTCMATHWGKQDFPEEGGRFLARRLHHMKAGEALLTLQRTAARNDLHFRVLVWEINPCGLLKAVTRERVSGRA